MVAESYSSLGYYKQAELVYKKLVQDYPDNPWGYIGLGDMYFLDHEKDYVKAKEFYEKSLAIARDKSDIKALKERLEDLENEIKE